MSKNRRSLLIAALACAVFAPGPARAQDSWKALVACCYPAGDACEATSTGYGSGATRDAAVAQAVDDAMSDTDQSPNWRCNAVSTFSNGCGYIVGACNEQTKRCDWAIGSSKQEAFMTLSRKGYAPDASDIEGGCAGP